MTSVRVSVALYTNGLPPRTGSEYTSPLSSRPDFGSTAAKPFTCTVRTALHTHQTNVPSGHQGNAVTAERTQQYLLVAAPEATDLTVADAGPLRDTRYFITGCRNSVPA